MNLTSYIDHIRRKIVILSSVATVLILSVVYLSINSVLPLVVAQASPTPVNQCLVYAVDDDDLVLSQFFYINTVTKVKTNIGSAYNNDSFESLDLDPSTKILYSIANNSASTPYSVSKGHLYKIDALNGKVFDVGDANTNDAEAISFRPGDTTNIWFWEEQDGLYKINKTSLSGKTKVKASPNSLDFQGMAWNNAGDKLYISSEDGGLWEYVDSSNTLTKIASNLPSDNDSLEIRPDNLLMTTQEGSSSMTIFAYNVSTKARVPAEDIIIPATKFDVEGIVWPEWCGDPQTPTTPTPTATPTPTKTPTPTPTPAPQPPTFTSFNFSCKVSNGVTTPFKLTANIITSGKNGATIAKNYAVIAPAGGTTKAYAYSGGTVSGSYMNESVNVPSYTNYASANYSISNKTLPAGSANPTFTFDIDFGSNTSFFQTLQNGFDLYLYIEDSGGRTNLNAGNLTKVVTNYSFNPYNSCGKVYFSTLSGDYRSNEPGAYHGKLGTNVIYNSEGNKYWQTQNTAFDRYKDTNNEVSSSGLSSTSTFMYEARSSLSPRSTSANSIFNADINTTTPNIKLDTSLTSFSQGITDAVTAGQLNKYAYDTLGGAYVVKDVVTKTITLRLANLAVEDALIEVDDPTNTFRKLVIEDSETTSPNKLIVWCKIPSCEMTVTSIKTINTFSMDPSTKDLSYDKTGLQSLYANKSRVYLNYLTGETATTPVKSSQTYLDNGVSKTINPTRSIEFKELDLTKNNLYIGAMMTNGFVFTSKSAKTDIVKGMIMARGMVTNATDAGTVKMYFKDFPNPYLLIDFDPKYAVQYANMIAPSVKDTKFKYLGF